MVSRVNVASIILLGWTSGSSFVIRKLISYLSSYFNVIDPLIKTRSGKSLLPHLSKDSGNRRIEYIHRIMTLGCDVMAGALAVYWVPRWFDSVEL